MVNMCVFGFLTRSLANFFIQCDTLIKYLVDSLQSFESGHGDALHPIPKDPVNFFMGDHTALAPATTEEVRQLGASISRNIQALATTVQSVFLKTTNRQQDILQSMIGEVQTMTVALVATTYIIKSLSTARTTILYLTGVFMK